MIHNVTAVIPAYNEEKLIKSVIIDVSKYCSKIIVINDGSTDDTLNIISKVKEKMGEQLIIINNEKNMGIGYSMKVGFEKAIKFDNEILLKIDGDGQHIAEDIPKFVKKIVDENFDYVKGNRFLIKEEIKNMPLNKLIGNLIITTLQKIISGNYKISDPNNGFIAFKKNILQFVEIKNLKDNYFFENSLLINATAYKLKIGEVGIKTIYNEEKSSIPLFTASIKLVPTFITFLFVKNKIGAKYNLSINSIVFYLLIFLLVINIFINSYFLWVLIIFILFLYLGIDLLNFFSKNS